MKFYKIVSGKHIIGIALLIWAIFSAGYIIWDIWTDFKEKQLTQVYQQGRVDTIDEVIKQAQSCQPFPIFSRQTQIQLINVDCLNQQNQQPD